MDSTEAIYHALTARHAALTAAELAAQTQASEEAVARALDDLMAAGKALRLGDALFVSDVAAKRLRDTAQRTVATFHKRNPYRLAMRVGDLIEPLAKAATVPQIAPVVDWLIAENVVVREGNRVRLPGHAVLLPPHWQHAAAEMLPVFEAGGLNDPPWPGNFRANYPRDVPVDVILDALAERGELFRLADDLYVAASAVAAAKETIRALAASGQPLTVGTIRDATGSSRRVVVPLLELLDAQGFTLREGESRTLANTDAPRVRDAHP